MVKCGHQIFLNTSTWKTMWAFWLISNAPAVRETSETVWVWQRMEDRLSLVSTSKDGSYLSPCRTENSQWEGCLNSIWPSNACAFMPNRTKVCKMLAQRVRHCIRLAFEKKDSEICHHMSVDICMALTYGNGM